MSYLRLALCALLLLALAACNQRQSTPPADDTGGDAPSGGAYEITLGLYGEGFTAERAAVFADAAARWEEVVVGDLQDGEIAQPAGWCSPSDPGYTGLVDDVRIHAVIEYIDGEGGILGQAGPCLFRQDTSLAYGTVAYGVMRFDSADVELMEKDGSLRDVILHEMGHVLGVGGIWEANGFLESEVENDCMSSSWAEYVGPDGASRYHTMGGTGGAPVEEGGGEGTKCAHWDDDTFGNELMTGYLSAGANPLSEMTVGALADLGYEVDYAAADDYSMPSCSPTCLGISRIERPHTEPVVPMAPGTGFTPLEQP